ncbi:MAG TPA: biotin/lipoyl-containing protein [Pyrinomonadaceae bacterium]
MKRNAAGTLLGWMKKPGDEVKRGDIIAEVDTDKGVIEIEVFTSGIIEKFLVEPGDKAKRGIAGFEGKEYSSSAVT